MRSVKNKLGLATELSAFAGTCLGNMLVGAGIFILISQNVLGALIIALGIAALVPTYYGIRPAKSSDSALIMNPVPMFLAVVHERSKTSV